MIDPRLTDHPASRFAADCLRRMRLSPNPTLTPLLDLVMSWLDNLPREAFRGQSNYLPEIQTAAHQLAVLEPAKAVAMLVYSRSRDA